MAVLLIDRSKEWCSRKTPISQHTNGWLRAFSRFSAGKSGNEMKRRCLHTSVSHRGVHTAEYTALVLDQHCTWSLEVNYVGPMTCRASLHDKPQWDLCRSHTARQTSAWHKITQTAQVITGHILFTSTLWLISFRFSGERVSLWTDSILKKRKKKFSGCVINHLH